MLSIERLHEGYGLMKAAVGHVDV